MSDLPLFLIVLHSSDSVLNGRKFELPPTIKRLSVGSDPACNLEVRSPAMSRRHARFERRDDGWYVIDENSATGTYIDGVRVTERRLRDGDKVQVGDTLLTLAEMIVETQFQPRATDGLTGLPTKRHLLERLESARRQGPLSVIRIDVDKLRLINSDHGHETGDRILREIGARLRAALRPGEYAGRLSADDFVVVVPNVDVHAATARAEELRAQLLSIAQVSVGAAAHAQSHRDADELIYAAEKDLFARYRR